MARFKSNPSFQREIAARAQYTHALAQAAQPAAAAVRAVAPRRTGAYARSISVVVDGSQVRIESSDPFAHLVEFGSANNPPYAPLRRGVRAAGLRLDETAG